MKALNQRKLVLVLSTLIAPMGAHATNGMFMIGYGAKSVSMGGAAIANPQDSLAGAVNPATIGEFATRGDVAAEFFLPDAYACVGTGTARDTCEESRANTFLIPGMAMAMKFNRKLSFGFSAVGAGGGGSRYNTNLYNIQSPGKDPNVTLGVNLMVMQMNPTVAYRFNKQHTLGASLIMSVQTFRAFGLEEFSPFATDGSNLSAKGNDWSYGAGVRVGWLGKFFDEKLMLGVSGSPRVYMTEFRKYDNLFAEQGDFDTPPVFGIGASYKLTDKTTIALDVTHTLYSDIASVSNVGPNFPGDPAGPFPASSEKNALGKQEGLGFGWKDQTVYKLGVAYQYDPAWTFRAGWNYGKSPVDENREILFNVVAPAVTEHHFTLGAGYQVSKMMEVNLSYMRAFSHNQFGPTYIGTAGKIGMSQNSFGASLGLSF